MNRAFLVAAVALGVLPGCRCDAPRVEPDASADASPDDAAVEDAGEDASDADAVPTVVELTCPGEMVRIARRFCIDRFEASLVDAATGTPLSPYYPPSRKTATYVERLWQKERLEVGDEKARAMQLPELPAVMRRDFEPRAVSRKAAVPSGYVSGLLAAVACKNAGKRLCSMDEWRTACRGERDRLFPYGDEYALGKCNIYREGHPAVVLHDNASKGHLDPRLNQVRFKRGPGLRKTGDTPACVSEWEGDGVHDLVGNLDEWIEDPEGTFLGGFYSRSKTDGCDSTVKGHTIDYFDYSTGVRCCLSPEGSEHAAPVSMPPGDASAPP